MPSAVLDDLHGADDVVLHLGAGGGAVAGVSALQGAGNAANPMDGVPRDPSGQPIYLGGDAGLPPQVLEY